jgi:4-amino-4-deoxy-L-arabinose transferase-like glycosyltransferase
MSMEHADIESDRRFLRGLILILVTYLCLVTIRYVTPDDLGMRDQQRVGSYITDIVQNGNWLCPRDAHGGMTSKPPMQPWVAAAAAHAFGGVTRTTWMLPSVLAMLVAMLTLYIAGGRVLGWEAALVAAMIFLLSHLGPKMIGIVRTDAMFACVVLLNALAILRIWEKGRGWNLFWGIAIINTLIKGPLGVILASTGLLALVWERRRGHTFPLRGALWPGGLIWFVVSGGWLLAAWSAYGDEVINEIIGRELLRHAVSGDSGELAILRFYEAPLYLLSRFAPWSFFTIAAIVRIVRRPAAGDTRRRFERFMACWIVAGLAIFSLAGHQRPDLIFPLIAPSAWLAGSVLADLRWLRGPGRTFAAACVLAAVTLPALGVVYAVHYPDERDVRTGLQAKRIAGELQAEVGTEFPIVYASVPLAMQIYQGLWRHYATDEIACDLLLEAEPVFVAVNGYGAFIDRCERSGATIHVIHHWDGYREEASIAILGNRETIDWYDPIAGWAAPFTLVYRGIRPAAGKSHYLGKKGAERGGGRFLLSDAGGELGVRNTSERPSTLRLDLRQGGRAWREEHPVEAGGELRLTWPPLGPDSPR